MAAAACASCRWYNATSIPATFCRAELSGKRYVFGGVGTGAKRARYRCKICDRLTSVVFALRMAIPVDLRIKKTYRALFDATDAVRPRAADWRGPLLVAISATDQIVDSSATRFFFSATNAAPAKLAEMHAAGHVLPLDYGHAKLAEKIARFILDAPAAATRASPP